jgi:protein O-GlcNAc transferase
MGPMVSIDGAARATMRSVGTILTNVRVPGPSHGPVPRQCTASTNTSLGSVIMATKTRLQVAAELLGQGRLAEAKAKLVKELRLDPQSSPAAELLGAVLFEMGKHDEAIEHLRRALRLAPSSPGPRLNLGKALLEGGRADEAVETLAEAVRRWPDIAVGRFSYANALLAKGEHRRAIEEYRVAIGLAPRDAGAYANLALALSDLEEHEAVCEVCERLLGLEPSSPEGGFLLARSSQILCAWDGHEVRLARFAKLVQHGHFQRGMARTSMLFWDNASLHRRCAELAARYYSADKRIAAPAKLSARKSRRIRVAYVSADFRQHPVTWLIAGLIEGHDRDRFEIVGISLGRDDGSAERHRLAKAFDRFLDVNERPTDAIVQAMREMEIDIAVDLMGYTRGCRPGIFLQRVAPVQASYLGYPGTSGIAEMDYLLVDPFIAAGELRQAVTERLAILPDCYLCNDSLGQTLAGPPSRSSCGLPEDAFVLCSFNDRRKLTPEVFDQWMRIMHQIEGSVLWLREPPGSIAAALRTEAECRGMDPGRIIFADRVDSHEAHIARNGVPDLHLDTFPYNAHTTASDALRAGCPILTRSGTSFPARVCGSLLTTIGVPELITHSAEEYESLALRLARDKAMLSELRRRIEHGRAHSPLFDTARFCRTIERAYEAMIERSRAGKPPAEIDVRSLTGMLAEGG